MGTKFCLGCRYPLDYLRNRYCPECGRSFDPTDETTFQAGTHRFCWESVAAPALAALAIVMYPFRINWMYFPQYFYLPIVVIALTIGVGISGMRAAPRVVPRRICLLTLAVAFAYLFHILAGLLRALVI